MGADVTPEDYLQNGQPDHKLLAGDIDSLFELYDTPEADRDRILSDMQ